MVVVQSVCSISSIEISIEIYYNRRCRQVVVSSGIPANLMTSFSSWQASGTSCRQFFRWGCDGRWSKRAFHHFCWSAEKKGVHHKISQIVMVKKPGNNWINNTWPYGRGGHSFGSAGHITDKLDIWGPLHLLLGVNMYYKDKITMILRLFLLSIRKFLDFQHVFNTK